jgi:hypothetical protein
MKVYLHHFSKIKCQKEVTKQKESRFSGGPKTYGSDGSGSPTLVPSKKLKNLKCILMWSVPRKARSSGEQGRAERRAKTRATRPRRDSQPPHR